ncbi:TetR/AcrR family transcriptional regulator [Duganella radicis]|uniref:TetR family transcriptional regulator n=1 Tax=Duganella radicis TaxID=551988 RepID=A0A6L6PEP5_9BURK|nr:helix-turn-helix domain-containing protein [Duganella radicis]MTV37189.1 TetR family transcriptional regulator [Duganella radicis]
MNVTSSSPVSDRTRNSILDAAAWVLARDPGATIAQIAQNANMSRSTVHRHFPERESLVHALRQRAGDEVLAAYANVGNDLARIRLLRLAHAFFDRADLLIAAYVSLSREDQLVTLDVADPTMRMLIERGHVDGSIDTSLHPAWFQQALWGLLFASWKSAANGSLSRFDAQAVLIRALEKLLAP